MGKSALINRLAGRKAARSENRAGVTRSVAWVRGKGRDGAPPPFELLDSPGIIPAKQIDQRAAARLAMCGRIGEASYDERLVAAELLYELAKAPYARGAIKRATAKYGVDAAEIAPDLFVEALAHKRHDGDESAAASAILNDFRSGRLGQIALEAPPAAAAAPEPAVAAPAPVAAAEAAAAPRTAEQEELARRLREGDFSGW